MISLIDTNVLIRFLTNDKSSKYKKLYAFFNALEKGALKVELKLIVLFQTAFVLKSYYQVPKEDISTSLIALLKFKGIQIKEKNIVMRTLELWHANNIEIVDCYLLACLEKDSQNIIYSYDHEFDKHPIRRKEP